MTASKRPRVLRDRRFFLAVVAVLLLALAFGWWWAGGADERRIDRACGEWLKERPSLRTAVAETEEAVSRAQAADSTEAGPYFNDLDTARGALELWERRSADVRAELDEGPDSSDLERSAVLAFSAVDEGVTELRDQMAHGDLDRLLIWTAEVRARFQSVDDVCLVAARAR
jgi:hypothetical protein